MAEMTHCDGPDCSKSKRTYGSRVLSEEAWVSLSQARDDVDFCGRACAIEWLQMPMTSDRSLAELKRKLATATDGKGATR